MKVTVGKIQGYEVIYIPEKDILFCKNTAIEKSKIIQALESKFDRISIKEKNLTIVKDKFIIKLGCLTTNKENINHILTNIKNYHGSNTYSEH